LHSQNRDPALSSEFLTFAVWIGFAIGILFQILRIGWHMFLYVVAVAEWQKTGQRRFSLAEKWRKWPWSQIIAAFAFGIFAGAVSIVVFFMLGVQEGEFLIQLKQLFPTAETSGWFIRIPIVFLFLITAAISEEFVFRGGIWAFFVFKYRDNRIVLTLLMVAISLVWALMHISNTSAPLIKVTQIFILGLLFAEFARRSCVQSAIAAHIGLNISVASLAFILASIF
jgi:membrane protease YdiL (CAAX protease family)